MDNLRGILGAKRINKIKIERIRELCGIKKIFNDRINESSKIFSVIGKG